MAKRRQHFAFRFGKNPRDEWLLQCVEALIADGTTNLSDVIKELLTVYFAIRFKDIEALAEFEPGALAAIYIAQSGHIQFSGNGDDKKEDPNDPLVQRLAGISFENL